MNVRDILKSSVRTVVPIVVGLVISWLSGIGIDADPTAVENGVTVLIMGGYHTLIRLLESKWPWFGTLLGWAVPPSYDVFIGQSSNR